MAKEIKAIIRDLPTNKAAGGEIAVNILKKSNFSFDELTICVNYALNNGTFPITLKNASKCYTRTQERRSNR